MKEGGRRGERLREGGRGEERGGGGNSPMRSIADDKIPKGIYHFQDMCISSSNLFSFDLP